MALNSDQSEMLDVPGDVPDVPGDVADVPGEVPGEQIEIKPSDAQLNIPLSYNDGLNMLGHLLSGRSNIYTSEILTIMLQQKIKADDPMFLLLLCIAELELLLVDTPLTLMTFGDEFMELMEGLFQQYFGDDADTQQRFDAANAEYLALVASGADKIVDSVTKKTFYGNFSAISRTIAPAFGIVAMAFGLGVFGTLYVNKLSTRSLVAEGKLSVEQLQALEWAQSKEGKKAKEIMSYNQGYIGKPCKEDAKSLGVKLNFGNKEITKGICVLFVDSPY